MHLLTKVFVENKAEDVVAKVIRIHFAAQGVGNVPEFLFELLFLSSAIVKFNDEYSSGWCPILEASKLS